MAQSYFQWLIDGIHDGDTHSLLLHTLYSIDYYYDADIPLDGARGRDGLKLRENYIKDVCGGNIENEYLECVGRSCTVLEWLLGMAIRCEKSVMYNEYEGDRTMLWFWSMLDNIGISEFTNDVWNVSSSQIIRDIINDILARNVSYDGAGGPFPIANPYEDMSKVDWWRMMNIWISENFNDETEFDL